MKQLILNALMFMSFVVMVLDIILYYEQPTGRITIVIAAIIAIVSFTISDYLEDNEEA